ncbi:MAG: NAD-dependent epimerase/dehydratase family protein [Candidatus Aminicenantes bacterium]|nr:NAD-dependent epimerase/dehydratase family protein [Candidatus Aminicenantes bacterium]
MKVFVTGASGFIGRALVRELLKRKHQVDLFLHEKGIPEENFCQVHKGDICDSDKLKAALKGVDILYHLAASMGASQADEREFIRINQKGTEAVFKAAMEAQVKKGIHFSSAGVLGDVAQNKAVAEDYPANPISVYDRTKWEGEKQALAFSKQGMKVVVLRPGWVYGPGDKRTFKLIQAIANKKFVFVIGEKTLQTPVYIRDLIKGILLCAEKGKNGEIYHLGGDEVMTVRHISECIADAAQVRFPVIHLPLALIKSAACLLQNVYKIFNREAPLTMGRLAFFVHSKPLSIRKAREELGFSPEFDFQTGIHKTIGWYQENNWL